MRIFRNQRIFLVCVAIFAIWFTRCDSNIFGTSDKVSNTDFTAEATDNFDIVVTGEEQLRLEAINGAITLTGDSLIDSVHVVAQKHVGSESTADAEAFLKKLTVTRENDNSSIHFKTNQPSSTNGRDVTVNYTVVLPESMVVFITATNGAIQVDSMKNDVMIDHTNGSVTLNGVEGSSLVRLVNGPITSNQSLPLNGAIDLGNVNGDISLTIPQTTSATVTATIVNGQIVTQNLSFVEIETSSGGLDGKLGEGSGEIVLNTVNGNITLTGK